MEKESKKKAYIYIDGLNFYYGLVKKTSYKWLDFSKLMRKVIPSEFDILKIKYFTTIVKPLYNKESPKNQKIFLRALKEVDTNLEVFYGSFLVNSKSRYLKSSIRDSIGKEITKVKVIEPEEKGTDVNLAIHLLNDSWLGLFDCAVIVSNDSDFAGVLDLVKRQFNKEILLIPPISAKNSNAIKGASAKLSKYVGNNVRLIHESSLKNSQLPTNIPGTNIRKPNGW